VAARRSRRTGAAAEEEKAVEDPIQSLMRAAEELTKRMDEAIKALEESIRNLEKTVQEARRQQT